MTIVTHIETVIVSAPPKPRELYQLGWNRYCDGLPLPADASEAEKRGYKAANRACAETLTDGYAESMGW